MKTGEIILPFKQGVRSSSLRWVTTSSRTAYRSRRLFYKSHRSLIPSLLLSKPNPLRWASVWFDCKPEAAVSIVVLGCSTKKDILRDVLFCGFRRLLGGSTHLIAMLGRSEFALRRGFAQGQNARTPQKHRRPDLRTERAVCSVCREIALTAHLRYHNHIG